MRLGYWLTHFPKHLNVKGKGLFHKVRSLFNGVPGSYASRDIWRIRRKIGTGIFNDDCVFGHRFLRSNPACFTMLLITGLGRSLLGWPATVTQPDLDGWWNWR